ncbi:MAG: M23 family metallopeptidase [Candidatus Rokuibacteriota bacterium]
MDNLAAVTARLSEIRARFPGPPPLASPPGAAQRAGQSAENRAGQAAGTGAGDFQAALSAAMANGAGDVRGLSAVLSRATAKPLTGADLLTPVQGRVSSVFGPRLHPVHKVMRPHTGIDLAAPSGTPIQAAAAGRVTFAGPRGGYGNLVILDHGNGLETYYAHQRDLGVRVGDVVAAGQRIGTVGATGTATGPHLHFEVRRDGAPQDPAPWLA